MRQTMKRLFLVGLVLLSQNVRSQSMTVDQVRQQMSTLFEVDRDTSDGQDYVYERLVKLPPNHVFADLVGDNDQYISYIKTNYSTTDYAKIRSSNPGLKQATVALHQALRQDTLYNQRATELAYCYLRNKGTRITGYVPPSRQTVSKAELMEIASRFFHAHSVDEAPDSIGFHVCVGMNGYQNNRQLLTNPLVEAFCFMALFQNLHNPDYPYWTSFVQQVRRVRDKYRVAADPTQRVESARREIYSIMARDSDLERALLTEYARKKGMLSFSIVE